VPRFADVHKSFTGARNAQPSSALPGARWVGDPPCETLGTPPEFHGPASRAVARHATVTSMPDVQLTWRRFDGMVAATKAFKACACVYVIADPNGTPLYIGVSKALGELRYRGGTAAAFDAALHGSGNIIFVAESTVGDCEQVEKALIWAEKPPYNRQGKIIPLSDLNAGTFIHDGEVPVFDHRKRAQ
jgi:hypothetical protein